MRNYVVYQQGLPLEKSDGSYKLNLQPVSELKAENGKEALKAAHKMKEFRIGRGLGRWPIVEEVDAGGWPVAYHDADFSAEERVLH